MQQTQYKIRVVEYKSFTVTASSEEEAREKAINDVIWDDHLDELTMDIEAQEV